MDCAKQSRARPGSAYPQSMGTWAAGHQDRLGGRLLNAALAASVLIAVASGLAVLLASGTTDPSKTNYLDTLDKPSWQPPDSWFGPVWSLLYVTIAVAFVLSLVYARSERGFVARVFGINIALNAAWTPIFFGLELPLLAGVEILLLWASCVWLARVAWTVRRPLGLLLAPYVLWVSFATVLNWSLVFLNS